MKGYIAICLFAVILLSAVDDSASQNIVKDCNKIDERNAQREAMRSSKELVDAVIFLLKEGCILKLKDEALLQICYKDQNQIIDELKDKLIDMNAEMIRLREMNAEMIRSRSQSVPEVNNYSQQPSHGGYPQSSFSPQNYPSPTYTPLAIPTVQPQLQLNSDSYYSNELRCQIKIRNVFVKGSWINEYGYYDTQKRWIIIYEYTNNGNWIIEQGYYDNNKWMVVSKIVSNHPILQSKK